MKTIEVGLAYVLCGVKKLYAYTHILKQQPEDISYLWITEKFIHSKKIIELCITFWQSHMLHIHDIATKLLPKYKSQTINLSLLYHC